MSMQEDLANPSHPLNHIIRLGRFLTVFAGLSMEHSWRAFSPLGVSTKSRQAQALGLLAGHA